jgi:hypothetical protein
MIVNGILSILTCDEDPIRRAIHATFRKPSVSHLYKVVEVDPWLSSATRSTYPINNGVLTTTRDCIVVSKYRLSVLKDVVDRSHQMSDIVVNKVLEYSGDTSVLHVAETCVPLSSFKGVGKPYKRRPYGLRIEELVLCGRTVINYNVEMLHLVCIVILSNFVFNFSNV